MQKPNRSVVSCSGQRISAARTAGPRRGHRGGVTLVELLVAIGVVAALLSFSIPAIVGVRRAAGDSVSLSRLNTNSQRFFAHAAEHGVFPVAAAPLGRQDDGVRFGGDDPALYPRLTFPQGGGIAFYYFANEVNWNLYLISVGDDPWTEAWFSPSLDPPSDTPPSDDRIPVWITHAHYHFSHAFMASPAYFGQDPGMRSPNLWRAQRPEGAAHPGAKALLVETPAGVAARHSNTAPDLAPTPIAFADGHADTRILANAIPPAPNPPSLIPARPLIQTLHGVLGRDFTK
ncbi:MAG: type II secretion system protein [Gemmatimonadetes bacterium]|nr:MAG: type II secretion system protein [Gemmatimonadota bacterium]